MELSPEEIATCVRVLQQIADSHGRVKRSEELNGLIAKVYKEGKRYDKRSEKRRMEAEDRRVQATTSMVKLQRDGIGTPLLPEPDNTPIRQLNQPETCYICKEDYTQVHFFYHLLCPKCAEFNYRMRHLSADLKGRTALLTGGRVKIGYQLALRLLRDGARVILTTRFPLAAALRFADEADYADWSGRLSICGLDLRNIPAVEEFARHLLDTEPQLDIIIHNAAQTIRRPRGFYNDLIEQERQADRVVSLAARRLVSTTAPATLALLDSGQPHSTFGTGLIAQLSLGAELAPCDILPVDEFLDNEEKVDSRATNSWLLRMHEVSAAEMLEVQLVNSVAPFLLNSRLKPLLLRSPFPRRFIVNVSAMEGQFARHKTVYHPHTNMAKAALNMMTRTSADDYAKDGIYMNSVDTGWVTDENPTLKRSRLQEESGFFPPLDIADGMARIYHPIALGLSETQEPLHGMFLKDYKPCPW